MASQHAVQPAALLIDWGMHVPPKLFLDLPDLGLQSLAFGLAPELETATVGFRSTDVGKDKGLRPGLATVAPVGAGSGQLRRGRCAEERGGVAPGCIM